MRFSAGGMACKMYSTNLVCGNELRIMKLNRRRHDAAHLSGPGLQGPDDRNHRLAGVEYLGRWAGQSVDDGDGAVAVEHRKNISIGWRWRKNLKHRRRNFGNKFARYRNHLASQRTINTCTFISTTTDKEHQCINLITILNKNTFFKLWPK